MKKTRWILALPLFVVLVQILCYYPLLPEKVASHWGGSGHPNGWSSKSAFFLIMLGTVVGVTVLFGILSAGIRKIPVALINLPRKDYWLAPERRDETHAFMSRQLVWFGFATGWFFVAVLQLSVNANLAEDKHLDSRSFLICLGAYLVFTIVWVVGFLRKFFRTP